MPSRTELARSRKILIARKAREIFECSVYYLKISRVYTCIFTIAGRLRGVERRNSKLRIFEVEVVTLLIVHYVLPDTAGTREYIPEKVRNTPNQLNWTKNSIHIMELWSYNLEWLGKYDAHFHKWLLIHLSLAQTLKFLVRSLCDKKRYVWIILDIWKCSEMGMLYIYANRSENGKRSYRWHRISQLQTDDQSISAP